MFEKALRMRLRFPTARGEITVEDLWSLPLQSDAGRPNLDDLAKSIQKQLKSGDDVSFVDPERKSNEVTQMAFDIVLHVIRTLVAERDAKKKEREVAERNQRILEIIADKQFDELKSKSVDELRALLAA